MSGDILSGHKWWGRGVGEHYWHLVGRDEGYYKYPTVHRAAPTTEGDPAPNVKGAKEKPWVQLAGKEEHGVSPAAGCCLAQVWCRVTTVQGQALLQMLVSIQPGQGTGARRG